jgi:uncharacterized protein (DUF433 family)
LNKFENKLQLGNGIFTTVEIANILGLSYHKVHTWITKYWDGELGQAYEGNYSWSVDKSKAVGFHTLVEFYIMLQFAEAGVGTRQVLQAHKELAKKFDTPFPFAQKVVLEGIHHDGKKIYLSRDGDTVTLDGTKQLNLEFIRLFLKKLEFDGDSLAARYWPLGKDHSIVCDPHHRFGQPVIKGTNIQAEAIHRMVLANEPISFIAELYDISENDVRDAVQLFSSAA